MTKIMRVGVDLSKNVFVVYGEREQNVMQRTLKIADLVMPRNVERAPGCGFPHQEWFPPSRMSSHPWRCR
jgi:hypothetical protein